MSEMERVFPTRSVELTNFFIAGIVDFLLLILASIIINYIVFVSFLFASSGQNNMNAVAKANKLEKTANIHVKIIFIENTVKARSYKIS